MRRILIVGCGAMGGIFAAHLRQAADVTTLDVNAAHVDAIRRDGLRVEGPQPLQEPNRDTAKRSR